MKFLFKTSYNFVTLFSCPLWSPIGVNIKIEIKNKIESSKKKNETDSVLLNVFLALAYNRAHKSKQVQHSMLISLKLYLLNLTWSCSVVFKNLLILVCTYSNWPCRIWSTNVEIYIWTMFPELKNHQHMFNMHSNSLK